MNAVQLIFFRGLLQSRHEQAGVRLEVYQRQLGALAGIRNREQQAAQQLWMTRLIQRETDYLGEVKNALARIENGTFGFCQESGMPIGIQRLLISPLLTALKPEEVSRKERLYEQVLQKAS